MACPDQRGQIAEIDRTRYKICALEAHVLLRIPEYRAKPEGL